MEKNLLEIYWPSVLPFLTVKQYVSTAALVPSRELTSMPTMAVLSFTYRNKVAKVLLFKRCIQNQNMFDMLSAGVLKT